MFGVVVEFQAALPGYLANVSSCCLGPDDEIRMGLGEKIECPDLYIGSLAIYM